MGEWFAFDSSRGEHHLPLGGAHAHRLPDGSDYLMSARLSQLRGFGSFVSASRSCLAFAEVRQFLRVRITMKQQVTLAHQREVFRHHLEALSVMMLVA
jgi:hypothetical protein